jgi:hypothetical protein
VAADGFFLFGNEIFAAKIILKTQSFQGRKRGFLRRMTYFSSIRIVCGEKGGIVWSYGYCKRQEKKSFWENTQQKV